MRARPLGWTTLNDILEMYKEDLLRAVDPEAPEHQSLLGSSDV